ncbi:MAG: hypothetical protein WC889_20010, partial [Myxococcota bacterium]
CPPTTYKCEQVKGAVKTLPIDIPLNGKGKGDALEYLVSIKWISGVDCTQWELILQKNSPTWCMLGEPPPESASSPAPSCGK